MTKSEFIRTTVYFRKKDLLLLEECVEKIKKGGWRDVNSSMVTRSFLNLGRLNKMNLKGVKNEEELNTAIEASI